MNCLRPKRLFPSIKQNQPFLLDKSFMLSYNDNNDGILGGIFLILQYQQVLALPYEERGLYIQQHPDFLEGMLNHIGHRNGELRDQYNYRLFVELLSADQIPHDVLQRFAERITGEDFLLKGLGESEGDAVFTRSFAALWLTAILHADRQLELLGEEAVADMTAGALKIMTRERDLRSFVDEESGWAHAIAHVSDLLTALIQHRHFDMHHAPYMLQALKESFWKGRVYTDDEEERFVKVIEALIGKGVQEEILVEWVEQVFDKLEMYAFELGYTQEWFRARTNILHFMNTLYFTLKFSNRYEKLRAVTSIFIQRWMKLS